MIYKACKYLIENGSYEYEEMMVKLDLYLLGKRITPAQYSELVGIMDSQITQ